MRTLRGLAAEKCGPGASGAGRLRFAGPPPHSKGAAAECEPRMKMALLLPPSPRPVNFQRDLEGSYAWRS